MGCGKIDFILDMTWEVHGGHEATRALPGTRVGSAIAVTLIMISHGIVIDRGIIVHQMRIRGTKATPLGKHRSD